MPQNDIAQTYKSQQFRHENPVENDLNTVEFRASDPTNLSTNPRRMWANLVDESLKYTVDGVNIHTVTKLGDLPFISVEWYGATGSGDETTEIQSAITAAENKILFFPDGTYTTGPLFLPSNICVVLSPNTLIKARTGYGATDSLISAVNVDNITIDGNGGTLQMLKSEYVTGEQRHCLYLIGNENVVVNNLKLKDSGGDGIIMGGRPPGNTSKMSKNIRIDECYIDNMKRNGISVVGHIENVVIDKCTIKNTIGTAPQAGIDIEPNALTDDNRNITVRNCTLLSNVAGIQVLNNSYDVLIENNFLQSSASIRFYRTAIGNPSPKATAAGNTIQTVTGSGIEFLEVSYCRAHDNIIRNTTSRGINLEGRFSIPSSNNEIYNNFIDTVTTRGISLSDNFNCRVYGNSVYNAGSNGVYVQSPTVNASHDNHVFNNMIVSAANFGIDIESSVDCIVRGNILQACVVRGISVEALSHRCIVQDNELVGCGVANTTSALAVLNSDDCMVLGNTVRKLTAATLNAILIDSQADRTLIEDNDYQNGATTGISNANTSTVIKVNKVIDGSISPFRASALPTASTGYLGTIVLKSGVGVDDEAHICIVNNAGSPVFKKITIT